MTNKLNGEELSTVEPYFDREYYLEINGDVAKADVDPLQHFMMFGWRERRDPNVDFCVDYYLKTYPDVERARVNPFYHYLVAGRAEGRLAHRPLDSERKALSIARSPMEHLAWAKTSRAPARLDIVQFEKILRSLIPQQRVLFLSFSHDDYWVSYGGVQNLIREERIAIEAAGFVYLHASPVGWSGYLASEDADISLRLGDEYLGSIRLDEFHNLFKSFKAGGGEFIVTFHHLLRHHTEELAKIARLSSGTSVFWVHDFFTICPNYNLLRNDLRFCGAPSPDSGACSICVYGEDRIRLGSRMRDFFDEVRPWVLAPSASALALWRERASLPHAGASVQAPARLMLSDDSHSRAEGGRAVRIAHIGARNAVKGWPAFARLASRFADDPRYTFFQLATEKGVPGPGSIRHVSVRVTRDDPCAMIDAVAAEAIDVLVSWPSWPETFCYAAHEAIAGGALLVTHPNAGHVSHLLASVEGQGMILEDEQALHALLEGDGLVDLLAKTSRRRGALLPSGGTAAWLGEHPDGRKLLRQLIYLDDLQAQL